MLKKILATTVFIFSFLLMLAQENKYYHTEANAEKDIDSCLSLARQQHKFVMLMAGGNWCSWCIKFQKFCSADHEIDSFINKNFIWYHLNWSKENPNKEVFKKYGYPQRFGFPVFLVLDSLGNRIHTQNSEYLEEKDSYSKIKVIIFLEMWSPWGLNPKMYGD